MGAECEVQYRAVRVGLAQYAKHKGEDRKEGRKKGVGG